MSKHDLKNHGIIPAPEVLKVQRRTNAADIATNVLCCLAGILIVVLSTIVLFEGSL